jgi:hypothetical protein
MISQIKNYLAIGAILMAMFGGYQIGAWRYTAKIESLKSDYAQQNASAASAALARYRQLENEKQRAIDESAKIAKQNKAAADRLAADVDRMRQQIAASTGSLSSNTPSTVSSTISTIGVVLNECVERYSALAKNADGHALDAVTLERAWPR